MTVRSGAVTDLPAERGRVTLPDGRRETLWLRPRHDRNPAFILLHGGLGCVDLWFDFPQRLAARGHAVFAYSRLGHGRSDPASLPFGVDFMHREASDVLGPVIDAAGVDDTILIGHSDGASIAAIYAGSTPDSRIRALVLIAPHFVCESVCVDEIRRTVARYRNGDLRDLLARYHGENVDIAFDSWSGPWLHPDFLSWSIEEYLPRIDVPVLMIQGADDEYGTLRQMEILRGKAACPVETAVVPQCGHFPYRQQPEATLAAIEKFIRRTRRSRGQRP